MYCCTHGTFMNDNQLIMIGHIALPVMQCGGTNRDPHESTDNIHDCVRELSI